MPVKGKKLQRRNFTDLATLEKILEIGQSLITARDLRALLRKIARTASSVLGADVVVLYEYQEETDDISVPPVVWGKVKNPEALRQKENKRPDKESAVFKMLQRNKPFYAPNAREDWTKIIKAWSQAKERSRSFVHREGIASSAAVPLIVNKKKVGVLFVNYRTPHFFHGEEQKAIKLFATQAAVAIQTARLLQQERTSKQRIDTLHGASGAIRSALGLKETAERVLDELGKVIECRRASLQLLRGDTRTLLAGRGFDVKTFDRWFLRPISHDRLTSRVVASKEPLILSETSKDPDWGVLPGTADVKSWVGIPLIYEQETLGLVTLDHDQPGFYTPAIKDLLVSFANQAAIDIRNARLFDEPQRRIRDLEIVNNVVQIISAQLDTQDLFRTIVSQIADQLRCTHCTLFFPKEEGGELLLVPQVTHGVRQDIMTRRFKLDEGLVGWVFQHGESLVLDNVIHDLRFSPAREKRDQPRSMLVAPVKVGSQTIGVISADQDAYGWFSDGDRRLVDALAQQVGIAVQRSIGLELVHDIGNRINSVQKVEEILPLIVSGAIKLTNTTAGVIYLISEDGQSVIKSFEHPPSFNHPPPRMTGEGITRRVVSTGEVMIFPDIHQDPLVNPLIHDRVRSMIGIPLKLERRVIGVLYLNDKNPHNFTETEVSLLSTLADQAAIAIHKARLMTDLERQVKGHRALSTLGAKLIEQLDEETILDTVARSAADTLDCTHGSVLRIEGEYLVIKAAEGNRDWSLPKGRSFQLGQGVAGWVAKTGKPALVPNTSNEERFERGWSAPQPDPFSLVVVPILLGDQVYGVISVEHDRAAAFDEQDQRLLEMLALQTSQAVRNARLIERLKTLNQVGGKLSTQLDAESIYGAVAEAVVQTLDCTHCTVFALEHDQLVPHASHSKSGGAPVTRRFGLGEGIAGQVAQEAKPVLVRDAKRDERFVEGQTRPQAERSIIVVPVEAGDQVLGIISADQDRVNAFDERDLQMVETLALQAGTALQNARLFDESHRRVRDLEIVNRVTQIINSQLDPQHLLQAIASQIAEQLRCTHCTLFFPREENGKLVLAPVVTQGVRAEIMTRRFKLDEGLVGWVYQHGESLVLADVRQDPRFSPAREIRDLPRSMLVAPVKVGDQTIGVVSTDQDALGWFSESDRQLVDALAQQAGIAIQRAEGLKLLQDVSNQIISTSGEAEILQRIVSGAIELTHTTLGVIYLISEDEPRITGEYCYPSDFELPTLRLDKKQGLTYQILNHPEVISIPDVEQDERVNRELVRLGVRSLIGVPLTLDQKVIGVLYLNDKERHIFTETEQSLLSTLASQAAIAIKNAQLHQQERQRADALNLLWEISGRISATLDLDETLIKILEGAIQLTRTQSGIVRVLDESGQAIVRSIERPEGFDHPIPRYNEKKGMTWSVISSGELIVIPDVTQDTRVHLEVVKRGIRSMISLPIKLGDKVIGILGLNANEPRQFEEEKSLLLTLANQAAIAVRNAKVFQETRERATQLAQLHEVTRAISAELTDREQALRLVVENLSKMMGKASCAIRPFDTNKMAFGERVTAGPLSDWLIHPPRANGISWQVIDRRIPFYVEDTSMTPPDGQPAIRQEAIEKGVRAIAYLPLVSKGNSIGILYVNLATPHRFSENEKLMLELFASQAAIAIENAELYRHIRDDLERRIRELEVLTEIGRTVSNLGIDQILDLVYEQTARIIDLSNAQVQIAFYDDVKGEVSFPLAIEKEHDQIIDEVRWSERRLESGEVQEVGQFKSRARREPPGLNEYVIRTQEPLLIPENFEQEAAERGIKVWSTFGRLNRPTHSWLGVPMMVAGRVAGVISIQSLKQECAFDEDQQKLLSTVANQAAVAIENAKLYDEMEKRIEEQTRAWKTEELRRLEAEQWAYLGQIAGSLAHRVGNKGGMIRLCVKELKEHLDSHQIQDAEIVDLVDTIERNNNYLLKLSDFLFRPQQGTREKLDKADVRYYLEDALRYANIPESVEIERKYAEHLPLVWGHKYLVEAFVEIIVNAISAMQSSAAKKLAIATTVEDNWVKVRFSDTGRGIPPEDLDTIFELFARSSDQDLSEESPLGWEGHRGFGLWWVKTFLRAIKGEIQIEDTSVRGTTLAVRLRAVEDADDQQT